MDGMNWDDMKLLLAVHRAGSVSAAAKRLGVSHTTISRRLLGLERDLDARLFRRTARGLEATSIAREIAGDAERMERVASDIERAAARDEGELRGCVRLTATEALASRLLAPRLAPFTAAHPHIAVEITTDLRPLSLARQEAHVAVRLLSPDEPTSVGVRVGDVAYAPYATQSLAERAARGEDIRLVGYSEPLAGPETAWLAARYGSTTFALRSNSTASLVAAACASIGIAMLPLFVGDAEAALVRLADPSEVPSSELWVIAHRDAKATARVAALRRFVIDLLRSARRVLSGG
jgi:DNA-binding transcriptional LysR family regulator